MQEALKLSVRQSSSSLPAYCTQPKHPVRIELSGRSNSWLVIDPIADFSLVREPLRRGRSVAQTHSNAANCGILRTRPTFHSHAATERRRHIPVTPSNTTTAGVEPHRE